MQQKFDELKKKLEQLENKKTQLAEMCRIEQVVEMRERIRVIREKLQQYSEPGSSSMN